VPIAPRTYYAHIGRPPSKCASWEMSITEILSGYYEFDERGHRPPESRYGSLKMWAHLQHQCVPVARSTVERLMRANRWRGAVRARTVRTTVSNPAAARPADLGYLLNLAWQDGGARS
jgi:putative transposase